MTIRTVLVDDEPLAFDEELGAAMPVLMRIRHVRSFHVA